MEELGAFALDVLFCYFGIAFFFRFQIQIGVHCYDLIKLLFFIHDILGKIQLCSNIYLHHSFISLSNQTSELSLHLSFLQVLRSSCRLSYIALNKYIITEVRLGARVTEWLDPS